MKQKNSVTEKDIRWGRTAGAWIAAINGTTKSNLTKVDPPVDQRFIQIAIQLLCVDGESVCIPFREDDDFDVTLYTHHLSHAQTFSGKNVKLRLMERNACHANCAKLWLKRPKKYRIVSGFGFTDHDQMWRPHTWLLDSTNCVIDTTGPRSLYIGMIQDDEGAKEFSEFWGRD